MKKGNKALHNIIIPDKDKMRFLYDSKTQKAKSSKVPKFQSSEALKLESSKVKKSQTSEDEASLGLEVKNSKSSKVLKLRNSKAQDSKTSEALNFGSSEVQDIKTQAKYETFKKLTVLLSNKDIDTLVKFEREIMQNRDLKTERITKNSILRCLVKILPLIKFNKNKIPDENILMDRILKALEKKLNSQ